MPMLTLNGSAFNGAERGAGVLRDIRMEQWRNDQQNARFNQQHDWAVQQDERNFQQQKEFLQYKDQMDLAQKQQIEALDNAHYTERAQLWDSQQAHEHVASSVLPSLGMSQADPATMNEMRQAFVYGGPKGLYQFSKELGKRPAEDALLQSRQADIQLKQERLRQMQMGGGQKPLTHAQMQADQNLATMAQTVPYSQAIQALSGLYSPAAQQQSAKLVGYWLEHPETLQPEDAADLWFKTANMPYPQRAKLGAYVIQKQQEINAVQMGHPDSIGNIQQGPATPENPDVGLLHQQPQGQGWATAQQPTVAPQAQTVHSKAEYDALPSGSTFMGADGKLWRKP